MKSYFLVPLDDNSFDVELQYAECSVLEFPLSGTVRIDTGCMFTRLNLKTLLPKRYGEQKITRLMKDLKFKDIQRFRQGKIKCKRSKSVNTIEEKFPAIQDMDDDDLQKDNTVCFYHSIQKLSIGGCYIGDADVKINYDSKGVSLLGMNILKKFEISCGKSLVNDIGNEIYKDDYIFLGRVKEDKDIEYIDALNRYFGIDNRLQKYKKSTMYRTF
ncbi:MAG: hypothetical protein HFI39_12960 [Lachnospiraceae bacterium]|nr:hypothetical protein [Lachnospiraceae bacterium]